ncbi:hypothetical protein C8R44DRAFT_947265 [Mycena epipterygia]|nr:hypothetical protein C8R44DRAFT_947265 [Mycena epipterygia]
MTARYTAQGCVTVKILTNTAFEKMTSLSLPSPAMRDDEKVTDSDEAAAAKIWVVYIDEAEKYDKGLVESWKSDMEGLLIFCLMRYPKAALFSAIVTAFIIESYKTLNSDSGNLTVHLLSQISQQLAAAANGSTFDIPQSIPFTPPATSVVCNAFWFISLGLSLACALVATLVEQWAREFLHRTDMRSAPLIRARMFSYLYCGLRRFRMHTVVEIIPLLLHASLLFFFGGLVAFLIPVNPAMTLIAAALLTIVAAVYVVLTLLPLRYLDCPYRTPLSVTFWQVLTTIKRIWPPLSETIRRVLNTPSCIWRRFDSNGGMVVRQHPHPPGDTDDTMVEAIFRAALDPRRRSETDYKALVWTMKSLADESELEPFVEAIPDLLWTPGGSRRHGYSMHILRLVRNPDIRLDNRIAALLDSCYTGILSADDSKRRLIICYKAFWAIASLSSNLAQSYTGSNDALDFSHIWRRPAFEWPSSNPDIAPYFTSAKAETFPFNGKRLPPLSLQEMFHKLSGVPSEILFNYLGDSASLNSPPYQWERTQAVISQWSTSGHPYQLGYAFEKCLEIIINTSQKGSFTASDITKKPWIETSLVWTLLHFWCTEKSTHIPNAIVQLLNHSPDFDFHDYGCVNMLVTHLWSSFLETLKFFNPFPDPSAPRATLTALWNLAFRHSPDLETGLRILEALHADFSFPEISTSIIALIRRNVLGKISGLEHNTTKTRLISHTHRIFFRQRERQIRSEPDDIPAWEMVMVVRAWVEEARFTTLVEFLEACNSDLLPHKAAETLLAITISSVQYADISPSLQSRFAESIQSIYTRKLQELTKRILDYEFWDNLVPWLYDPVARDQIKEVFTAYLRELESMATTDSPSDILSRLQKVLQKLDS